jgi:predicted lipoprotein with Yx(FWY)xxD motif
MTMKRLIPLLFLAGVAVAQAEPAMMSDGALAGPNGLTLYTFDKDEAGSGKSMCNGKCAENWPPLLAGDADKAMGDWTVVAREDGRRQWAHKGKPLYYWVKDQKPGDRTGDGFNGVWRVAR